MHPVRLVLAVQDPHYVEPLLHYIQGSEYGTRLHITAFTRVEALAEYRVRGLNHDLIVLDKDMLEVWLSGPSSGEPWVYLSEGGEKPEVEHLVTMAKYQPLPQLLESWMALAVSRGTGNLDKEGTRVIALVSAIGRSGKTVIAMNLSRLLAEQGYKVFYLNLESVNSSTVLLQEGSGHKGTEFFSRLLYDLKVLQETGEPIDINRYIQWKEPLKCDGFVSGTLLKELLELTQEDTKALIQRIRETGRYDYVIVDSDVPHSAPFRAVLEHSDVLLWILRNDPAEMFKTASWLDYLEGVNPDSWSPLMGKSRFVRNAYTGTPSPHSDIRVDYDLPYIASWDGGHPFQQPLYSPVFQREILKLWRSLSEQNEKTAPFVNQHAGDQAYA
ncbi:AAA family ATPase [Paenibacillus lemnae]|uniref:AAA family ATPase n=1 Tax=Paenibacillus lemnae TaxID=1330551 RepID=A0A848M6F1_PAELE|nr:AAA family ATPase [Paenibacillus lemnae]NMO95791.1 AAA family ATPase [Paenibacillus lemnae]